MTSVHSIVKIGFRRGVFTLHIVILYSTRHAHVNIRSIFVFRNKNQELLAIFVDLSIVMTYNVDEICEETYLLSFKKSTKGSTAKEGLCLGIFMKFFKC